MERIFLTRKRAIEKIMNRRQSLIGRSDSRDAAGGDKARDELAEVDRLLLDIRAGRVVDFILEDDPAVHVFVSPD